MYTIKSVGVSLVKIEGYQLENTNTVCPYLENKIFTSKNLIVNSIDNEGLESLLENGYRHFGTYFFKPECFLCNKCRPIRIPVDSFNLSRSDKRVINKNKMFSVNIIDKSESYTEYYNLYCEHKKRFKDKSEESYDNWISSFFADQSFNKILEIKDRDNLVAVTHLDVTKNIISAVYCYWNKNYGAYSPGKFSILSGIEKAKKMNIKYYYLGYYIKENVHMSYKKHYQPNQILVDDEWK